MAHTHTFHIPVMGIGFTLDSPLKVAPYGIDSALSLGASSLLEKLRKRYCEEFHLDYEEIEEGMDDFRAKRITAYLNFVHSLVTKRITDFKNSPLEHRQEIEKYLALLPNGENLKKEFNAIVKRSSNDKEQREWLDKNILPGSIDVNIMTKLDRANYKHAKMLPIENNDAHAAVRGYALSDLTSSVILSAGINLKLFAYMEQFEDFYPDANGWIKKKIIIKVSDYRSALIQGTLLAKRGLWVSEYRIESGLNCGGHAFATEGYLLGPILEEFKIKKDELFESVYAELNKALLQKERFIPIQKLPIRLSVQGGVGTSEEHTFLLTYYNLDSVGWGSPFLLVPEATTVDEATMYQLIQAKEEDFYLSYISPLGVPFNSLRGTTKEHETTRRIAAGKPGSPCIEGNLALFNTEFSKKPLCTASRQYQKKKIDELSTKEYDPATYQKKFDEIVEKTCICTGLINSLLIVNKMDVTKGGEGVSICPGPNMFYFKKILTLSEMVDHIYGRKSSFSGNNRPNMFVKELRLYIQYLANSVSESSSSLTQKTQKKWLNFSDNLLEGIAYYSRLFQEEKSLFNDVKHLIMEELNRSNSSVYELRKLIVSNPVVI